MHARHACGVVVVVVVAQGLLSQDGRLGAHRWVFRIALVKVHLFVVLHAVGAMPLALRFPISLGGVTRLTRLLPLFQHHLLVSSNKPEQPGLASNGDTVQARRNHWDDGRVVEAEVQFSKLNLPHKPRELVDKVAPLVNGVNSVRLVHDGFGTADDQESFSVKVDDQGL